MPYKDNNRVLIHISVPIDVRDTINELKKSDGKYTREYVFMHGYLPVMGLTEDDPEQLKRDLEQATIERKTLEEKEKQIKARLESVTKKAKQEAEEINEAEELFEKQVSEIMRVSSEIIFFKNTQMLRYVKGLLSDKSPLEVEVFFNRKEIPTEDEIRAFLRG